MAVTTRFKYQVRVNNFFSARLSSHEDLMIDKIIMIIIDTADDADGDHVRCRWAESQLQECGEVCQAFPATLTETEVRFVYVIT